MIKLGHIIYSNCFPVHALLVNGGAPNDIELVNGTPNVLNRMLEEGEIDAAPSSSIEYARHAGTYRLLPDFVIGSEGAVGSILFESTRPINELAGRTIAVPTESATSVVLLRIILELKYHITTRFEWFSQMAAPDPIANGAAAALWIGDVALKRSFPRERHVYDLGTEWYDWTGLPFVFAAWQTNKPPARDNELQTLRQELQASHAYFVQHAARLAEEYAATFGIAAPRLLAYWQSLRYTFDESMQKGLLKYFELAAKLGETPPVTQLKWVQ